MTVVTIHQYQGAVPITLSGATAIVFSDSQNGAQDHNPGRSILLFLSAETNHPPMKSLHSIIILGAALCLRLQAQPVYDSEMSLATAPTMAQKAAISYLLANKDEHAFIQAYIPYDKPKVDDEFAATSDTNTTAKQNTELLEYAHKFLNGEIDYPVSITLTLQRYNPANQTFVTDARKSTLNLSIEFNYNGQLPTNAKTAGLGYLHLSNWNYFSGLKLAPALAKKLTETLGNDRTVSLLINCRLKPGSAKSKDGYSMYFAEATARNFKIQLKAEPLPSEIAGAIQLAPYVRTEAEAAFAKRVGNKVMVSDIDTIIFHDNGTVDICRVSIKDGNAESKIYNLANCNDRTEWYIIQGKVFSDHIKRDNLEIQEFDEQGNFRLGGIPYKHESRIAVDGDNIKWRP